MGCDCLTLAPPEDQLPTYTDSLGNTFHWNQEVYGRTRAAVHGIEENCGRLVQVRIGVGEFGSDLLIMRRGNGKLVTLANEVLKAFDEDQCGVIPVGIDKLGDEYTILNKWPETGFLVENPKQPAAGGVLAMAMTVTAS